MRDVSLSILGLLLIVIWMLHNDQPVPLSQSATPREEDEERPAKVSESHERLVQGARVKECDANRVFIIGGDAVDVNTAYTKIMGRQQRFDFHPSPIELHSEINCVVYTVIIGYYEATVKPFPQQSHECHWIAFTDRDDLKPTAKWQIRPIPHELTSLKYNSSRLRGYVISKYIKMLPFLLFPPSIQIAIFVDGTYKVKNSTFVERAVKSVVEAPGNHPIFFRRHPYLATHMEEILLTMERYVKVGTADLIVTQYIAHVAEGLCDNWFHAPRGGGPNSSGAPHGETRRVANAPRAVQATFRQLKKLLRFALRCNMTEPLLRRVTRRFFYNDTRSNRKLRCTLSPPHASTLPRFNASLLLGMPYPSGPKIPLYDSSMLAFRLHHANVTVRAFAEAFLKQWFIDSAIHGKDQLPQVLLLWRTPGYHPAILGSEFRRYGGPMLFRDSHGK